MLFDRRQQLCRGDARIGVAFVIEEFRVYVFWGV